jgi:hypothetical protein
LKKFIAAVWNFIKPEKNMICAYCAGSLLWLICHGMTALGADLTPAQINGVSAGAAVLVAHGWDSVARLFNPATQKAS